MKTKLLLPASLLLFFSCSLTAQNGTGISTISYKTETNNCSLPISQVTLDVNNVRATLLDAGDLWTNVATLSAGYEVPKAPPGQAGANAIYAGAIWISGLDAGNNLKIAALMYRQNGGSDYYSGPLDNTGNTTQATCNMWDRHFPVWATQIRSVITAYQAALSAGGTPGNITMPVSSFSDSIKFWPGKGNPYLTALGYDMSGPLAPFYDVDGDGIYDPSHGDYPTIMQGGVSSTPFNGTCGPPDAASLAQHDAYADQMIYWVFNDKGNAHNGSNNGQAIGVQVNALAFAFQTNDNLNEMTFYRYHFINKSAAVLNSTYISQFTDPDLGCPYNDMIGCDTTRNMAFVYNGAPANVFNSPGYPYVCDATGSAACSNGTIGYGCVLPVLGIVMAETPSDTTTYPDPGNPAIRMHRQLGMTSFYSFTNNSSGSTNANLLREFQTGHFSPDTVWVSGGNGSTFYIDTPAYVRYEFPGDPADATQWSMCHDPATGTGIAPYDRRMVQTTGSFTFLPCASQFMTIAVTFTDSVGSNCPSRSQFGVEADSAQSFFDQGFRRANYIGIASVLEDALKLYPNPVTSDLLISGTRPVDEVSVYDLTGRLVQTQAGHAMSTINMSALTEGVYMVSIRSGSKITTQKIVKR